MARALAALVLAAGMSLGSAAPAWAILPGIPSVVFDPTNYKSAVGRYAQMALQAKQQVREIELAIEQVNEVKRQAKGFTGFRLANFDSNLKRASDVFGRGIALGHNNDDLLKTFERFYPRMSEFENGKRIEGADEINAVRDLMYANITANRDQGLQLELARNEMNVLRSRVLSATTERQVAQAQAAIQAFQAEQDLMARQSMTQLAQQMAVMNAREVAREAAEFEAMRKHQEDYKKWEEQDNEWQRMVDDLRDRIRREAETNARGTGANSGGVGVISGEGYRDPGSRDARGRETLLEENRVH
jgi:conjugal transfer/entry exclusion protein